jgi:hypothetical protein
MPGAAVLVELPVNAEKQHINGRLLANGTIVDYHALKKRTGN